MKAAEIKTEINRLKGALTTGANRAIIETVNSEGVTVGRFRLDGAPAAEGDPEPLFQMLEEFFRFFVESDERILCLHSGRSAGKSWNIAIWILANMYEKPLRVLSARESLSSLSESSLYLFKSLIMRDSRLTECFDVMSNKITCTNSGEIIFKGMKSYTIGNLQSLEGIDLLWSEESQYLSRTSLDIIMPSIRKPNSRQIFSLNALHNDDCVYQEFILETRPDCATKKFNYKDNCFNSEEIFQMAKIMEEREPAKYQHIFGGEILILSQFQIYKDNYEVWDFTFEDVVRKEKGLVDTFKTTQHGVKSKIKVMGAADFGFKDPNAALLMYVSPDEKRIYIFWEFYRSGQTTIEFGRELLKQNDIACRAPLRGDSARPESIKQLQQMGINIQPCRKGPNSIIEGIDRVRSLELYVSPICTNLLSELALYQWRQNSRTGELTQIPLDNHNHLCDCLRYMTFDLSPLHKRGEYKFMDNVKWG